MSRSWIDHKGDPAEPFLWIESVVCLLFHSVLKQSSGLGLTNFAIINTKGLPSFGMCLSKKKKILGMSKSMGLQCSC